MPFRIGYTYKAVDGTLLMDGTEQDMYEFSVATEAIVEMYVDLSSMQAGDTLTVREYMKNQSGGGYVEYGSESYSGVQTIQLLHITPKPTLYGLKLTLEQTAGAMRTVPWQAFVEYR